MSTAISGPLLEVAVMAASDGEGRASTPQSYAVEVRSNDQYGNYAGSTTITPVIASLLGNC